MNAGIKNIDRFNNRADNYDKFRPGYPHTLLDYLYTHNRLTQESVITELGAGTGILSLELAKWPSTLIAIEPNDQMREKAIETLKGATNCVIKDTMAEQTGLDANSIDLIICAQSFHWFDAGKVRVEFNRILKDKGKVAIIWNIRSAETAFEKAYEDFILKFSIDYEEVKKRESRGNNLRHFFRENTLEQHEFNYDTYLTFDQLLGRTLSYSYMPNENHPLAPTMKNYLSNLFNQYHTKGIIGLSYKTKLFMGEI